MRIELLHSEGCPNYPPLLARLHELVDEAGVEASITPRLIDSAEDALAAGFLGSPSVRVDGLDVEPGAEQRDDFGLKCRLYSTGQGLQGMPADEWVLAAMRARR